MISNTLITYVDFYKKIAKNFWTFLDFFSFLGFFWEFPKSRGFSKIPGNSRDWDPTLFGKNPMGFKIPGIGIFFVGLGIPTKKPPLVSNMFKIELEIMTRAS